MPARGAVRLANGDDAYRLIVSDLVSLIVHAQASLRLIESAIDRESSSVGEAMSADVIVFDDVTPRCFKAGAALKACATCAQACCNAQQQAYHTLIGSLSLGGPPGCLLPCLPFRN